MQGSEVLWKEGRKAIMGYRDQKVCDNCGGRNGCPRPEFKDGGICDEYDMWANMTEADADKRRLLELLIENGRLRTENNCIGCGAAIDHSLCPHCRKKVKEL